MKIFVYEPPERHSCISPLDHSPQLVAYLAARGVEHEEVRWDGRLETLPNEPSMIRASIHLGAKLGLEWDTLVAHCRGTHVVFYDDSWVGSSGEVEGDFLILEMEVDKLLERT